jgi:hypothetical protein
MAKKAPALNASSIRDVANELFSDVFDKTFEFRKIDMPPRRSGDLENSFPPAGKIRELLDVNAKMCEELLPKRNGEAHNPETPAERKECLTKISCFHAGVMSVLPVQDVKGSIFLNRALALTLSEGQLLEAFGPTKTKVDGLRHSEALRRIVKEGHVRPIHDMFDELANVYPLVQEKAKGKAPEPPFAPPHKPKL